jgi:predicted transcriptional regulator
MWLERKTQAEIGRHFNRTERTIRHWIKEAKRRNLVTLKTTGPEDMLAQTFFEFAQYRADLLSAKSQAKEAGDMVAVAGYINQLRKLAFDKFRIAEKAGYIDGRFSEPPRNKYQLEADIVRGMLKSVILGEGEDQLKADIEKRRALDRSSDDDPGDDDLY